MNCICQQDIRFRKKWGTLQSVSEKKVLMQSLFRAGFRAFVAENAFCPIFTFAGFFVDLHVHRTYLQAFTAVDAFPLVAVNAQQGKIAHRLEKYCDRTQVFAERTVILEN